MLYAIFCYNQEDVTSAWAPEHEARVMADLRAVQEPLVAAGKLGPVARLLPTTSATTLRKGDEPLIIDGPFAETKEQLLGFYLLDVADLEEALGVARDLARANPGLGSYEVRPLALFNPGADIGSL